MWDHIFAGVEAEKWAQWCFFGATSHHPLIANMIRAILTNIQTEVYNVKMSLFRTGACLLKNHLSSINGRKEISFVSNETKDEDVLIF
jgi:hypothetical protein